MEALTVSLKLVIIFEVSGDLIRIILITLSRVNLQFQGPFVINFWRPIIEIAITYVTATVWSSYG